MKVFSSTLLSIALLSGVAMPVQAQNLLGIIGGEGERALVTIGSGDASSSGLINLGVGGDNLVDVQVGGQQPIAGATVGVGGGSLVDANVNLLNGAANVDATVGGSSLVDANVNALNGAANIDATVGGPNLVDVNIGVGGGGNGGGGNGGGGNGGGSGGGGNGGGGSGGGGNGGGGSGGDGGGGNGGGGNGGGGGGGGGLPVASTGGSSSGSAACVGTSPRELERLIRNTRIDGSWQRASNVAIQRVSICPEVQTWLASALTSTGLGPNLQAAVSSDPLLNASISRSSYNASRVFAVNRSGNQLTVFVY